MICPLLIRLVAEPNPYKITASPPVEMVPVLVYVDEKRVRNGPPKAEYVPRMNRAIRESVALGLPAKWAEEVMRPAIPLN